MPNCIIADCFVEKMASRVIASAAKQSQIARIEIAAVAFGSFAMTMAVFFNRANADYIITGYLK